MLVLLCAVGVAVIGAVVLPPMWRQRRRAALRRTPLPQAWHQILQRRVPAYRRLPPALRQQLHGIIQVLLAEKQFVGCAGLEVTDAMRVTIAAQAGLLLLNRETGYYPGLSSILVYPQAFFVRHESRDDAGVHSLRERVLSGESWGLGKVVVSWDDVERGTADFSDGVNVVLHEFAHQLDQESGSANGAPLLRSREGYRHWSHVFSAEYDALCQRVARNEPSLIDPYGATDPAEFFAVVTELFFERPGDLAQQHPSLYDELSAYYGVDPAQWA